MNVYILEGITFRKAKTMEEWAKYMETASKDPYFRHVARDYFYINEEEYCNLSTVFLGIDHNFDLDSATPILFESMIFGGNELDQSMDRYPTWEEAAKGHLELCRSICDVIYSKYEIMSLEFKEDGKRSNNYFRLRVPGFVKFIESDLRLIREN